MAKFQDYRGPSGALKQQSEWLSSEDLPPDTDVAEVVNSESVGFAVAPGDLQGIEERIVWCAANRAGFADMESRARSLAELDYDRKVVIGKFRDFLARLAE